MNKVVESLLGFKVRRSPILQARNSMLKLVFYLLPFNILLFTILYFEVPMPYMDEYFHEDQLAHYMRNDFKYWNDKITTPPGLYYFSYLFSFFDMFETSPLVLTRFINVFVCSNITMLFFMKIFEYNDCNMNNFSRSVLLALTPTIFFFNFLAYTDSLSLMFVTCAFYYNATNSRKRLFLCSLGALYARQNNIVWLLYLVCYRVLIDNKSIFMGNKRFFSQLVSIFKLALSQKAYIIRQFKYQIILFIGFIIYFKKYNEGKLVFGDSQNHQMCFHPAQILYLSLFLVLNLPLTLQQYIATMGTVIKRIMNSKHALSMFLFLTGISLIIIDQFTIVHPFITSDNRHYIFYIYKNLLSKPIIRYGLSVIYPLAIIFIFRLIVISEQTFLRLIILSICSILAVTITPLVEFRYFTIPLVFLSFEIRNRKHNIDIEGIHARETYGFLDRMMPMVLIRAIINLALFAVFVYLPFGPYQDRRFMW